MRRWNFQPLVGAVIVAVVVGGLWHFYKRSRETPLADQTLVQREFPGFSIELPTGDDHEWVNDYGAGKLQMRRLGKTRATLHMGWQFAEDLPEEGTFALAQAAARGAGSDPGSVTKLDHLAHPTYFLDKKSQGLLSYIRCGKRLIIVVTTSAGELAHGKIIATLVCKPDPEKENAATAMPLVADLPGFVATERHPGQLTLEDLHTVITVQRKPPGSVGIEMIEKAGLDFMKPLGAELKAGTRRGDILPFSGTIEGEPRVGLVRMVACPKAQMLIIAHTDPEQLDDVEGKIRGVRCARPGEAPSDWPDYVPEPEDPDGTDAPAP